MEKNKKGVLLEEVREKSSEKQKEQEITLSFDRRNPIKDLCKPPHRKIAALHT